MTQFDSLQDFPYTKALILLRLVFLLERCVHVAGLHTFLIFGQSSGDQYSGRTHAPKTCTVFQMGPLGENVLLYCSSTMEQ